MERCPKCRKKYDPSYTVACSNCGTLLVPTSNPVPVPYAETTDVAGFEQTGEYPAPTPPILSGPAPAPGARGILSRLPRWVIVWGILIAAGAIVSFVTDAQRGDDGEITRSGSLYIFDVQVGDCLDVPDQDEITDVTAHPCSEPHLYEVFALVDDPAPSGSPYNEDGLSERVVQACYDQFTSYVGVIWEESPDLDFTTIIPTAESWDTGDRGSVCLLSSYPTGTQLVGSKRNAGA